MGERYTMMRWLRKTEKVEVPSGTDTPVPEAEAEAEAAAAAEKTVSEDAAVEAIAVRAQEEEPEKETGPILSVKDVRRSFPVGGGEIQVLKGIDMEVLSGQLVMLKGRSGSGKTTLLNMLGGLDQPTSGEIWFRGQPLHELNDDKRTLLRRDQIGFIFQAYALLPLLSAWENVELSLRMAGVPPQEWKRRVTHCLELVGLGKRMFHRPFELSGGEQQRVAIAKAIAHRPKLLLADEPTANLDSQMGAQVMAVFKNIIQTERVTICMTTHDPTILEVADHVYEMVDGKFIG
jgi:putative ABC transport system ATP-binding protein